MGLKIKKIFLLFILFLLQSCSGGTIGDFLDSSFKNIEEPKIKKDSINNEKNKKVMYSGTNLEKDKNIEEPKIKKDSINNEKNKKITYSSINVEKNKNNEDPKIKVDIKSNFLIIKPPKGLLEL